MTTKLSLPPAAHYEYFSHLFHSGNNIPFNEFQPLLNCDYPELDRRRFERLFLTDPSYYQNQRVLDLGCHTGYFSYITKYLNAQTVTGVNVRNYPLDIARYAYDQLGQDNYNFVQGDIENLTFLKLICENKDTLIMTFALEHMRNPYAIMETISNSGINNLIFESSVFSDEGEPALKYYKQTTESSVTVFDGNRTEAIGACPNLAWIEMILYYFGWKIEYHVMDHSFNKNWFSVPDLKKCPPVTFKSVTILCKKFDPSFEPSSDNWEVTDG